MITADRRNEITALIANAGKTGSYGSVEAILAAGSDEAAIAREAINTQVPALYKRVVSLNEGAAKEAAESLAAHMRGEAAAILNHIEILMDLLEDATARNWAAIDRLRTSTDDIFRRAI